MLKTVVRTYRNQFSVVHDTETIKDFILRFDREDLVDFEFSQNFDTTIGAPSNASVCMDVIYSDK